MSEKKQSSEKRKAPELDKSKVVIKDGEYGLERGDTFTSLTNFILRCEGLVEDDGEVSGFMISAKPKNNRNTEAEEWLDSVFLTRRDMSDQFSIINKLGSSRLWISTTKDFLPAYLKNMCDEFERNVGRKLIPVKILGLQPRSQPPVWVFSKGMQIKLQEGTIYRLTTEESPYTIMESSASGYSYVGELDNGETLKAMITSLETFFDADIAAVLLVMGGAGMAFHYKLLNEKIGGVPPTLAVGDPVSGKSTAVEAALSVFDQRECIGAGSEAKLLDSLNNTTIPMWWDDIDSAVILEKMTVLIYNKAKKVTMGGEASANTIPIISINYTKLLKGFKRLQATSEDFGRIFTRMIPIPFQKREGKQSISERLEGKQRFEAFLRAAPKSVGVFIKLHEAFEEMTKSPLFKTIEQEIQQLDLDVRSQSNLAVLLYSTGKILHYIGMKNRYWADILLFIKEVMVPKYKALLVGNIEKMQSMSSNQQFSGMGDSCLQAIEQIFRTAMEYPNKAKDYLKPKSATTGCLCGEVVSFNVPQAFHHAGITVSSTIFRQYIKKNELGCTGKNMRLPSGKNVTCVHISRGKLPQEILEIINKATSSSTTVTTSSESLDVAPVMEAQMSATSSSTTVKTSSESLNAAEVVEVQMSAAVDSINTAEESNIDAEPAMVENQVLVSDTESERELEQQGSAITVSDQEILDGVPDEQGHTIHRAKAVIRKKRKLPVKKEVKGWRQPAAELLKDALSQSPPSSRLRSGRS